MIFVPRLQCIAVPTPYMVGPVNVYLLEGKPLTLVDCGPNTEKAYKSLTESLESHGYQLHEIEQVIITHHHTDHVGQIERILDESSAELIAHEYTVPYLENPHESRHTSNAFFGRVAAEGGVPAHILDLMKTVSDWVDQFGNAPVKVTRTVCEGATIVAGDCTWQVYHTPGHAGDLICLFDPNSRVLLSSDHLLRDISSNALIEPAPIKGEKRPRRLIEYITHMQRIANLEPVIAYTGHGDPVDDVQGLVAKRIEFHHKRAEKILAYFDEGRATLWELTERMFAHVDDNQKFLAISEVLGHVDLLEADGKLKRHIQNEITYWEKS